MKKPKTSKYYITSYHGDAFCIRFEVSRRAFLSQLRDNKDYAKIEEIEPNTEPNERGEYYNTEIIESDSTIETRFIFGCGTSETRFEQIETKEGYCFK